MRKHRVIAHQRYSDNNDTKRPFMSYITMIAMNFISITSIIVFNLLVCRPSFAYDPPSSLGIFFAAEIAVGARTEKNYYGARDDLTPEVLKPTCSAWYGQNIPYWSCVGIGPGKRYPTCDSYESGRLYFECVIAELLKLKERCPEGSRRVCWIFNAPSYLLSRKDLLDRVLDGAFHPCHYLPSLDYIEKSPYINLDRKQSFRDRYKEARCDKYYDEFPDAIAIRFRDDKWHLVKEIVKPAVVKPK